ncbi:MAG: hypothetical protein RL677_491 [Actinomycetota bacterium]
MYTFGEPKFCAKILLNNMKIAVDGPSGSGKSTISKALAKKYQLQYLDTGAMYRAVTAWVLDSKDELPANWEDHISRVDLRISTDPENFQISIDNRDVTEEIRTQRITDSVSEVSSSASVRSWMVELQRSIMTQGSGIVMEGRDIGTVVMPNADVKIFIEADLNQRSLRRASELGQNSQLTQDSLKNRDQLDSTRIISPLKRADDSILLDTTELNIDQSIQAAIEIVENGLTNG